MAVSLETSVLMSFPACFQNSVLAVAGEDETVRLCDMGKEEWLCEFKAHETRLVPHRFTYF